jgi:hypothetical protein
MLLIAVRRSMPVNAKIVGDCPRRTAVDVRGMATLNWFVKICHETEHPRLRHDLLRPIVRGDEGVGAGEAAAGVDPAPRTAARGRTASTAGAGGSATA